MLCLLLDVCSSVLAVHYSRYNYSMIDFQCKAYNELAYVSRRLVFFLLIILLDSFGYDFEFHIKATDSHVWPLNAATATPRTCTTEWPSPDTFETFLTWFRVAG